MRKKWTIALGVVMSVILLSGAVYAASDSIKLYVNGKLITPEVAPQIIDGNTMVPVRWISEALGAEVGWDGDERSVSVDWKEGDSLKQQVQLLQQAIAPESAEAAVQFWAKAVKERNGAAQYAVFTPELRKQTLAAFEEWNWVTGLSSPWVDSYEVTKAGETGEAYTVTFKLKTSTGSAGEGSVKVGVGQTDDKWTISGLDAGGDDTLNGIVIFPEQTAQPPADGSLKNPAGVLMVDDSTGWAWGDDGQGPALLRTTDGGRHWSAASLDGLSLTNMNTVKAFFADANTGWLGWSDGQAMHIAHTADGGGHWKTQTVEGYHTPVQFSFVDSQHGWLIAAGDAAMMHSSKTVYRTEDGGATWKAVSDNSEAMSGGSAADGALPALGSIAGMTFADVNTGFAAFDNPVSDELLFYRTSDGGATWSDVALDVPSSLADKVDYSDFSAPVFSKGSKSDGVVTAQFGGAGGQTLVVYATDDGGKTWTAQPGTRVIDQGTNVQVSFADASHGWLLQGSDLYLTTDGLGWEPVATNDTFKQTLQNDPGIREFAFADAQHGVLIASSEDGESGQTIATADGGMTWLVSPLQGK